MVSPAWVEYDCYDFDGTDNGLPDHLQAAYGHIAVEYVVKDFPGVGIELDPGVYFQDQVSGDAFDIPGKAFVSFPLKKDKIFAVVALGWGLYQDPPVAPGGGIIWLFSDNFRLQAVFPKVGADFISPMTIGTFGSSASLTSPAFARRCRLPHRAQTEFARCSCSIQ